MTKPNHHTTIDNLRELARHAENWTAKRFNMEWFHTSAAGKEALRDEVEPECGSSCCLIGIANAVGMHPDSQSDSWLGYSEELFPSIASMSHEWGAVFGGHLDSDLKTRIKGLRKAANMLESKGRININKLPK